MGGLRNVHSCIAYPVPNAGTAVKIDLKTIEILATSSPEFYCRENESRLDRMEWRRLSRLAELDPS